VLAEQCTGTAPSSGEIQSEVFPGAGGEGGLLAAVVVDEGL
jgi:hypothetical protein